MDGATLRAGRIFDGESQRAYVVAIDHGLLFGVQEGSEDAVGAVERVVATEPDAVMLSAGLLARAGQHFARRGAPSPVVRLDFLTIHPRTKVYGDRHRVLCSPARAASLGADAVVMYFMLGTDDGATFADNLAAVARGIEEAHAVGLAFIAEVVVWGGGGEDQRDAELLSWGCRVAAEMGADLVKTEYTGDPESMGRLVDGCPAPVLVLGGAKVPSVDALLDTTRAALGAGASGVIYGRNIWQADDPVEVARTIRGLVHEPSAVGA